MRLAPGRLECSLWDGCPGCSLADSLDPGLTSVTPPASKVPYTLLNSLQGASVRHIPSFQRKPWSFFRLLLFQLKKEASWKPSVHRSSMVSRNTQRHSASHNCSGSSRKYGRTSSCDKRRCHRAEGSEPFEKIAINLGPFFFRLPDFLK